MTADPDARLLRRATVAIVVQVTAAVAATVALVSALAFSLTIHAEHRAEELRIEGSPGRGARFTMILPARRW
jgi:hypothetical protein